MMVRPYVIWIFSAIVAICGTSTSSGFGLVSSNDVQTRSLSTSSDARSHQVSLRAGADQNQDYSTTTHDSMFQETVRSSSRREWMSSAGAMVTASILGRFAATAEEVAADGGASESSVTASIPSYSIAKCPTGGKAPCLSTANVRQLDLYMPPWTFQTSADEAMARLKGAIVSDSSCSIVRQDGNVHLLVSAKRVGDVFGTIDELEFIVNDTDRVVTFRSASSNDGTDFGINRKRLDDIRKRAGIFGIMGETMQSADSFSEGEKGYGAFGQLKAFYGLQSGQGFEDVFE